MPTVKTKTHTDIKHDHPIISHAPQFIKPYLTLARIDRPIGVWLLLLPSLWAIALAAGGVREMNLSDYWTVVLFCLGALVMRSAGCVINDLWDRELDQKVERTKQRPLAAGLITPKQAIIFLSILLFFGLIILCQMNLITFLLGVLAVPLIIIYPLMKRFTWWPQAFLGIVFNFGALMGWSAISGIIELPALLLYASCILWTLGYDTIYAHQDKEDDALIGIKSSALKLGKNSKKWVKRFYIASALILICSTALSYKGLIATLYLFPAFAYLIWILRNWDEERESSALQTFKDNRNYGLLILAGLILS